MKKKWSMLLVLLLVITICFPDTLAAQEAVESAAKAAAEAIAKNVAEDAAEDAADASAEDATGEESTDVSAEDATGDAADASAEETSEDNGGEQTLSYIPGKITAGLLAETLTSNSGKLLTMQIHGKDLFSSLGMPDLILRLGAGATQQGARLELGLREGQENVGFDAVLDADAQGISIESDLLPGERYTISWNTLLGMDLNEMAGQLGTIGAQLTQASAALSELTPLFEPYTAIINSFMQEMTKKEYYDVPEEDGMPPMAYEIYLHCTHAQAAQLFTQLAEQLKGDTQLAPVLDALLAGQELSSADLVEMMQDAAASLAESEGSFVISAGTNYDMASKPWFVNISNTDAEGESNSCYLGLVKIDTEDNTMYFNLGYLQTHADESLGNGADLMISITSDKQDPRASDWAAELTVTEGETETSKLQIGVYNSAVTMSEDLPGYENTVYVGVGAPEIFMEYEHEMNRYMTADGGEALTLKGTLCPDTAQKSLTYDYTLDAGIAPGTDGPQGKGSLIFKAPEMPEQAELNFDLYEDDPVQFDGESTIVALDTLTEEQMNELSERIKAALTQCLDAMPVQQTGE